MDHKTYLQPSCFIGNFNLFKTKQKLYDYSTSGGVADLLGRTCKEAAEKITFLSPFGNSTVIQFKFLFSMILAVAEKYNMKLLTHNMLTSKCMKAVTTGYPLAIQARDVKVCTTSCQDFVIVIIFRWARLSSTRISLREWFQKLTGIAFAAPPSSSDILKTYQRCIFSECYIDWTSGDLYLIR